MLVHKYYKTKVQEERLIAKEQEQFRVFEGLLRPC